MTRTADLEDMPQAWPVPSPNKSPGRPVMLLIDDETSVGRMLAHAAEECGYRAVQTTGADSFRSEYREQAPDIVALDLGMPGADGIELLRFLCEQKCTKPVLIISGFDRRVLESSVRLGEAMGLNMAGSLTKPVRLHELEALLQSIETGRAR